MRDPQGVRFVAVQAALFVAVAGAPAWTATAAPGALLRAAGVVLMVAGAALAVAAGFRLGRLLTPMPVPVAGGELVTRGVYAFARHPMYGGVLLLAFGWSAFRGSWVTFACAVALWALFEGKSRFEERALAARYATYPAYRARTKRFVPFVY